MRGLSRLLHVRRLGAVGAAALSLGGWSAPNVPATINAVPRPLVSDVQNMGATLTPPTEAQCNANGRRCFAPAAFRNAYNLGPLYALGDQGQGVTIALIDSFGNSDMATDLNNFNTQFGLQHLCGEANYTCQPGDPTFKTLCYKACTDTRSMPAGSHSPGTEARDLWVVEVALDVEWSHAVAPKANILLVTTPTAETLGVQGFPQMMNAEQFVVDNGLAQVISQSFGASELDFEGGVAAMEQLRGAFKDAKARKVSVFASSGDFGNSNLDKTPVGGANSFPLLPVPNVGWPGSDPLVSSVGGTYLCADAATGLAVDSTPPSGQCPLHPGQREVGWVAAGGGFSSIFAKPSYQNAVPPGSNTAGNVHNTRMVPDVAMEASSRTGVLVYAAGTWFTVGGTSVASPTFAGVAAIADQVNGAPLGFLNPAFYTIANNPAHYAADFFDVTTGNNDNFMSPPDPNYAASAGWDPVTGVGTPNAANLVPDLIRAATGQPL
jgi:subtilase family serine protease